MEDQRLEKIFKGITKLMLSHESQMLELLASLTALKVTVASLTGDDPKEALLRFAEAEKRILKSLPASQSLQELRDLIALFEKHGKALGKNKA